MGFTGEHAFLGPATPLAVLKADFSDPSLLSSNLSRPHLFNLVEQQPSGDEPIETLLPGRLTLNLKAGWTVQNHHTGCQLIDILAPFSPGPYEGFLDIALVHTHDGHPLGELLLFLQIHMQCSLIGSLPDGLNCLKSPSIDQATLFKSYAGDTRIVSRPQCAVPPA
jgi:hypothetical protein